MRKNLYIKGELNCAETIIAAYNEEKETDIPVALGSGLGSGATVGSICGAVNAAAIVIGALKGRENKDQSNDARAIVNELMKSIKTKYGTEICIDLKKSGVSCEEIVDYTYNELNRILEKY